MVESSIVVAAAFLAGFVDAVVGGGGLIQLPALLGVYPAAPPVTLLGTNKSASIWGTAAATWHYARHVPLPRRALAVAIPLALAGGLVGAWLVSQVSAEWLRRLLPALLVVIFVYTLARPDLGTVHAPVHGGEEVRRVSAIAAGVGTYDGFFGPGTGNFLVFLLVRTVGYDFLHASACARAINLATNVAAFTLFAVTGHVWWWLTLPMAAANVAGSMLGSRVALRHGAKFVRILFLVVVAGLIVKTATDAFWK